MTPAEVAELLRVRQMRERRAQAAAQAARRAEQEATALRTAAEKAQAIFATAARQQREATYVRLENGSGMGALALQAAAAELAGLREQESGMMAAVRRTVSAEAARRTGTEFAAQRHAATQRGAEALEVLAAGFRAAVQAMAEQAEEAEEEAPRARP